MHGVFFPVEWNTDTREVSAEAKLQPVVGNFGSLSTPPAKKTVVINADDGECEEEDCDREYVAVLRASSGLFSVRRTQQLASRMLLISSVLITAPLRVLCVHGMTGFPRIPGVG